MLTNYVIAAEKIWHPELIENLTKKIPGKFSLIQDKSQLSQSFLQGMNPQYLFFTHWSSLIKPEIYENYECVIFHMTDLPFGRGGSPLQNLIARGIYQTKLSALRCTKEIDAGPIYLQYPLSLTLGSAQEIYNYANIMIEDMIIKIVTEKIVPQPQQGDPTHFTRRKPEEGNIFHLQDFNQLFDYIRMLDAEGYPHAYLETEYFHFEFRRATIRNDEIIADVKITRKKQCQKQLQ